MDYHFAIDVERLVAITEPYLAGGFSFLSAGASDGVIADPVYPLLERWGGRGVAAEPVPYVFDRLVQNYAHHAEVVCLPVAVAPRSGTMDFWYVEPGHSGLEYIVQAMGTSTREHLLYTITRLQQITNLQPEPMHHPAHPPTVDRFSGSGIPGDLDRYVRSVPVEALTFDELLARARLDHVDLVNLDVEGLDYDIFTTVDWQRWRPAVVIIETYEMTDHEQRTVFTTFADLGYRHAGPFSLFSNVFVLDRP
jgi:FkbM family methyltransferase